MVCGAISGTSGGGILEGAVITGIGWAILAWSHGPPSQETLATLFAPRSQRLVLRFTAVHRGAMLEAPSGHRAAGRE